MFLDFLLERFETNRDKEAIIWNGRIYHYKWLLERVCHWRKTLERENILAGSVAVIEADFSPNSVALFLALIGHECILVPLTSAVQDQKQQFIELAQAQTIFTIDEEDEVKIRQLPYSTEHKYYKKLRKLHHPGLILFSSGSTGKSKAAVHDMTGLLEKFKVPRHSMRMISFLLYDHIGGINTLLYGLSNGGCIVTVKERNPDAVLSAVERYQVENFPTSPTFINLILLSEAYKRYDLSSLKMVTYGTEPMSESTLKRFHELFPNIKLVQTYGLSEVGILRSKSKSSDSLWVKVGGEDFQTRVVDGILQIKAKSAMLGYLNAPSPFTDDGWFHTGDVVRVNGEYIKILGRKSKIINVGGEKVYPAEVEDIIQQMDNVAEVSVYGEKNAIMGNIICARVRLRQQEDRREFVSRLKKHCRGKLPNYKVPVKVKLMDEQLHTQRFKKVR